MASDSMAMVKIWGFRLEGALIYCLRPMILNLNYCFLNTLESSFDRIVFFKKLIGRGSIRESLPSLLVVVTVSIVQ